MSDTKNLAPIGASASSTVGAPPSPTAIDVPPALTEQEADDQTPESRKNLVNQWSVEIRSARDFWQPSYERMRDDMRFSAGLQWGAQDDKNQFGLKKYTANIVQRQCALKVATLYSKNPEVSAKRRPKMDFKVWDGTQKMLMQAQQQIAQAMQQVQGAVQVGAQPPGPPPMAAAVIQDYANGMKQKAQFDKLAETLEMVFTYQMEGQHPAFKTQMKALVLRAVTTNVGYLKIAYRRDTETMPTSSTTIEGFVERLQRLIATAQELKADNNDPDSPLIEDLRLQSQQLAASAADGEMQNVLREGLVFDFPPSTSIIVDPACRCLEDFVGADWIAHEFVLTPQQVQAQYGIDVRGSSARQYIDGTVKDSSGKSDTGLMTAALRAVKKFFGVWDKKAKACVWEIYSKTDQTKYVICDGWPDFLEEPESPQPQIENFWPIYAFVKNRIEVEENLPKEYVTIYGESDVRLMRSQQEEKNRSREALRLHRIHNKDVYVYPTGGLSPTEMENIASSPSGGFIPLAALAAGKTVAEVVGVLPRNPIDKSVYDDTWVMQDVMLTVGTQDADLGNAPASQTATGQSIAQASRMTSLGSDIDSLDDFLSKACKGGGEMILLEMGQPEVDRICGPGAAQLPRDREAIKNELYLDVEAASSGKPNRTVDVQNFTAIAPQLQQLWAMLGLDPTPLLKYGIKIADMNIDLDQLIDEARVQQQSQGGAGGKGAKESMMLSTNYKDLPPEVQTQVETALGFTPASPLSHIVNKVGHANAATPKQPTTAPGQIRKEGQQQAAAINNQPA